jgi:alanine racemase
MANQSSPPFALRPTVARVDLGALRRNIAAVRSRVGSARIMGIIKANAYGHGLVPVAEAMVAGGVHELGVGFVEEGVALRRAGVRAPILVLGGVIEEQIPLFFAHDLDITAASPFKLEQIERAAAAAGARARVHLKIDTGMGRIGMQWDSAHELIAGALGAKRCEIRGVFTHLAASESPDAAFTDTQLDRFEQAIEHFSRRGRPMPLRHVAGSAAILQHPRATYDMVRPGIMLYGVYPSTAVRRTASLHPVLTLESRVVFLKGLRRGRAVSYAGTPLEGDVRVATLPIGYGDGYPRSLSGKASVLLGGRRCPVLGAVTMDALMVEVGKLELHNGDRAVLLGSQGGETISAQELADLAGTIPYEILSSIGARVPRVYVSSDEGG